MSAVGSGSILFTPRVGSEYGYELLWLLWGVALLMWVMIREAGRFAVLTGRTLLDGFSTLPGPRNWVLWFVFVPQLLAAVVGVGGLSALVGSALAGVLPGGIVVWSLLTLAASTVTVVSGGYRAVSRVALILALVLVAIAVVAAATVFPGVGDLASGVVPGAPAELDVPFVLPWIGTILAGSMGIIWYSYWAATRGYGGGAASLSEGELEDEQPDEQSAPAAERGAHFRGWLRTMSNTALLGVVTGTLIITSFLVLGAELLGPEGIVPSGVEVATELTRLLSEVWGRVGYWLMTVAIVVALGGSVLANQDGWSRSFADITLLLPLKGHEEGGDEQAERDGPRWLQVMTGWRPESMGPRLALKVLYAVVTAGLLPAVVIVVIQDPVTIMSVSGIVATLHTPFIVFATLALNRRLPAVGRPGPVVQGALGLAGIFYTAFAAGYFADLLGLLG
jgi:Mn2+/Fe2+ NRAMP family transporter